MAHDQSVRVNTNGYLLGAIAGDGFASAKSTCAISVPVVAIAMQLAQRFEKAYVDALNHGPSARQATENFANSPYAGRMVCYPNPSKNLNIIYV